MRKLLQLVTCAFGILIPVCCYSVSTYTVMDIGIIPSGLNNSGDVAGCYYSAEGTSHAAIWENGRLADIGTLGGSYSAAVDVNSTGMAVGSSTVDSTTLRRAFAYADGAMTDLGTLGGAQSFTRDLNDSGYVVGRAETVGETYRAFVWSDGQMTDLHQEGWFRSGASGINQAGEIVGYAKTPDSCVFPVLWRDGSFEVLPAPPDPWNTSAEHINDLGHVILHYFSDVYLNGRPAVERDLLWRDGNLQDLGTLGVTYVSSSDINDHDQVVGQACKTKGDYRPFLWQDGVMYDLNELVSDPGLVLTSAVGINDAGQIACTGYRSGMSTTGFLLTPVPEPSALMVLLCGLAATAGGAVKRRRRAG